MVYIALFFLALIVFLARFNFFRVPKKGVLVLLYHRVSNEKRPSGVGKFAVSPETFRWQLRFLKRMGYVSILPEELESIVESGLWKRKRFVIITFDDGYYDNLSAAEIMKNEGFRGIFFISTAYIGSQLDGIQMMSAQQIDMLLALGMRIGSHSHEHVKLSALSDNEIKYQVDQSLRILSAFCGVRDFAYPFGDYDSRVLKIVRSCGIERAYIIGQRIFDPQRDSSLEIPRAIVRSDTTKLDFYLLVTRGRSKF